MLKHIKLTSLFVLLSCIFFGACAGDDTKMMGEDNAFRVKDPNSVTRIFMADRNGGTVKLEKQSDGTWLLNDKWKPRKEAIQSILETLNQIRVRFSINEELRPTVEREMATSGIKVEVYEGSHKKTFYVGGPTTDQAGSYMCMADAKKIYVAHIANFQGVLTPRFITREADLRDRTFFDGNGLTEIWVEYPGFKDKSFKLSVADGQVTPFYVSSPASSKPLQPQLVRGFLDNLHLVQAEAYIPDSPKRDSIIKTTPFCNVTLHNNQKKVQTFSLYPVPGRIIEGTNERGSVERYYIWYNQKDFVLSQTVLLKNLFWSYDSFFSPAKEIEKPKKPIEKRYK